ncbi:MAG: AarF/ABC1/UbiB kinase family protein [Anaerolineae bacterium]|nr:AarF/ABC1/UbiB kinase family protein [Anaerolineae bacterium]
MAFPFPWRQRVAEIARVRGITQVLVRNGLGFLVEQFGLDRWLPRLWRRQAGPADATVAHLTIPQRLRRTLEELGPTYIKLGQQLSGRGDLLPPEYIAEFTKLLDAAPPVPTAQIRAVIEEELGVPVASLFAAFDDEPIASASIGQVHRATLPGGQPVVVKVRRPGVEATVEADLRLLLSQVRFLARRSEVVRQHNLVAVVEELARALREELDYKIEGRNAERLRSNFNRDPRVAIPAVHWHLTSRRIITLDYLDGIQLNEPERLRQRGIDLPAAVRLTVEIYLTQIFDQGFYQADPHPANIMVIGSDRIGLVDFGTAGYLLPRQKDLLGAMFLQLFDQDAAGLARTLVKMGAVRGRPSLEAMERDLQRLLVHYWGVSLEQLQVGEMLADIFKVAYEHRVYLPGDLTLLGKTILTMEGTARALDPEFVLADAVRPFAERLVRDRLSPLIAGRQALRAVRQAADLAQAFPRRLDDLWDQLEEGELTVGIDVRRLNVLISRLNSMLNRLAFAVVVAALIVGSALILHGGKDRWELPILGVGIPVAQIVFLVAFGAGVWLIISMIRSRGV